MSLVNERSVLVVGSLSICLGISGVSGRFWARKKGKIGLGTDDWLCLAALVRLIDLSPGRENHVDRCQVFVVVAGIIMIVGQLDFLICISVDRD